MATDTATATPTQSTWTSRAVSRLVEAGSTVECTHCEDRIKFQARVRNMQVICNVYEDNVWQRVEHFHDPCYLEADSPWGPPVD